MNQAQTTLPLQIPDEEIYREVMRKQSLGSSIELCMEIAGWSPDKSGRDELEQRGLTIDKAQFSRWKDGSEGIIWSKFEKLMDVCGNDAPLFWMNHRRNVDLYSLRRCESDLERENRRLREENQQLKREREVERNLLRDIRVGA